MNNEMDVETRLRLNNRTDPWTEILSLKPRAYIHHNFLSKEECEHLIKLSKPYLERSRIYDERTEEGIESSVRTSSETTLRRGKDKIIKNIEQRIADITSIPVENGEGLQVIHYGVGQKFVPHYDSRSNESFWNGGPRVATFLMSDVEEGGETVFPSAKPMKFSSVPWLNVLSKFRGKGLSVKPKMGDALLFWSIRPDGTLDKSSLHGGNPVIRGNKWVSTKFLHRKEFEEYYEV